MEKDQVLVTIEKLSLKGYGVGTLTNGKKVEVAHSAVGDELIIHWKKKRRDPQKGRLLEVIQASQNRVAPKCAHASICGGCSWQQIDYSAQLKIKEKRVQDAFDGFFIDPIVPADPIFHYRNKMEFTFSENRAGEKFLGLMIAQAEPYVFHLTECHLGPSWFSKTLVSIKAWWSSSSVLAYKPDEDKGSLRYVTFRHGMRTNQKMIILNVSGNAEYALKKSDIEGFVQAVKASLDEEISIFLRIHQTKKGTPTQFFEMHLSGPDHLMEHLQVKEKTFSLKLSPISFFQPNSYQAERLYEKALDIAGEADTVFDLYSGTATLAMAFSLRAKKVIGIELSPEAVLDAQENLKRNHIENVTLYQGDVGKVLTELLEKKEVQKPDLVIVDPPRKGLDALALGHLKRLLPQKILYISCNPISQSENIQELLKSGYRLKKLQPVDQFPHTYHIENIALLVL